MLDVDSLIAVNSIQRHLMYVIFVLDDLRWLQAGEECIYAQNTVV